MSVATIQIFADDDIRLTGTITLEFKKRYLGTMHGWNWNRILNCWQYGNVGGEKAVMKMISNSIYDESAQTLTIKRQKNKRKIEESDAISNFKKQCALKNRTLSFFESSFLNLGDYNDALKNLD